MIFRIINISSIVFFFFLIISCNNDNNVSISENQNLTTELRSSSENAFFVDINSSKFQDAIKADEYIPINGIRMTGRNILSTVPYMDDDKMFLLLADDDCTYVSIHDKSGQLINTVRVECLPDISVHRLDYNAQTGTLSVVDPNTRKLHVYDLIADNRKVIELPFLPVAAHFIEQDNEWVFLSVVEESGLDFKHKIIYTNADFNIVHEIVIPSENKNMPMAKPDGFSIVDDKLYLNTWGSSSIYHLSNRSMLKVYELPIDLQGAGGISSFRISDDFIYLTVGAHLGGFYSIYFDRNTGKYYVTPLATSTSPIDSEYYKFYNFQAHTSDSDYLYLTFTQESATPVFNSNLDPSKYSKLTDALNTGADLVLYKYKINTEFLETISSHAVPSYLEKD